MSAWVRRVSDGKFATMDGWGRLFWTDDKEVGALADEQSAKYVALGMPEGSYEIVDLNAEGPK